jgi:uncharacterized protein (DUF3820 family)
MGRRDYTSAQRSKNIITPNSILLFGKYKGRKAIDVHELNPLYFRWVAENLDGFFIDPLLLT